MVVLVGVLTRDLGGGRRAQALACLAVAGSTVFLTLGHLLSTATFDALAWIAVMVVVARILDGGDPRLWLLAGALAGLGMLNKHLMALLVAAIPIALLVGGRGALLRSRWPWLGGLAALAVASPDLLWQAAHGWPQLVIAGAIHGERGGAGGRLAPPPRCRPPASIA